MKSPFKLLLVSGLCLAAVATAMDDKGYASIYESIAAFENRAGGDARIFNRPDYVKPIITNLGPVLNSNWYVSATVPQSITFEAGLPFSLIPIGDDDKTFNQGGVSMPTIFGTHGDPQTNPYDQTVYGNETLNKLGVFTYPYLQLAGGFYHARLVLRGMWLPAISELQKFNLIGFGLQYSFGHLFQYMLPKPAQGLDVSLVLGYSSSGISYQPEDYDGTLDLDISAFTFDLVIGYKPIEMVEVLLTLGYQSASMASSGHLVSHAEGWNGQEINPNLTVDGNDGFKFGIAVAFQFGSSFHPVLGYDYAGKSSFTTNILYFKQQFGKDKTPDEIAKEKGYVRGGNTDVEGNEAEESPKTKKKKALKKKKVVEEEPEEEEADSASAESDESEFDDFDEE
ncbi:MAG: hypothetical protein IJ909_06460 [Fibrobacter sp.]|nr:hypothetical protein [Fibrobacter sp.]